MQVGRAVACGNNPMKILSQGLQMLFRVGAVGGLSDGKLLEQFAASRDEAVFEALLVRHGPMVWGVCHRILRDPNDAEDAFQATFLVLARKASSIAHREMVANWLYAVAYKTAVRARAMAARRRVRERQAAEMPEPVARVDERPDDLLALLDQELSRLPATYRIPVVLCDLEGKTHKEAASQLGLPVGTLSSRLSRARAMLAKRLTRHGVSVSVGSLAVLMARDASATVPTMLISATAQAASSFAAGGASGVVVAPVLGLTNDVLKIMLASRLKITTLALLILAGAGIIWIGAGVVGAGQDKRPEAGKPAQVPPAKTESPAPVKWRI